MVLYSNLHKTALLSPRLAMYTVLLTTKTVVAVVPSFQEGFLLIITIPISDRIIIHYEQVSEFKISDLAQICFLTFK